MILALYVEATIYLITLDQKRKNNNYNWRFLIQKHKALDKGFTKPQSFVASYYVLNVEQVEEKYIFFSLRVLILKWSEIKKKPLVRFNSSITVFLDVGNESRGVRHSNLVVVIRCWYWQLLLQHSRLYF